MSPQPPLPRIVSAQSGLPTPQHHCWARNTPPPQQQLSRALQAPQTGIPHRPAQTPYPSLPPSQVYPPALVPCWDGSSTPPAERHTRMTKSPMPPSPHRSSPRSLCPHHAPEPCMQSKSTTGPAHALSGLAQICIAAGRLIGNAGPRSSRPGPPLRSRPCWASAPQ